VKKKPKGLIGRYKLVGQVTVGLVVGSIIFFFPSWIDPDLWKLNTSTTVPFFKGMEFDFGAAVYPGGYFRDCGHVQRSEPHDGLDGLAIGIVAIVGLTLAVMSYISGNVLLAST